MGRNYLTSQHDIQRAFWYPSHAAPEAIHIIQGAWFNFPLQPPMFDIDDTLLYYWKTEPAPEPHSGPKTYWRRDLYTESLFCEIEPPVGIPYIGHVEYSIQFWPDELIPSLGPGPYPGLQEHRLQVHWDNFFATPWRYARYYSTLTGMVQPGGWNMFFEGAGLASPPCTILPYSYGWQAFVVAPAEWSVVSEPLTYAESDPKQVYHY